MSNKLNLSMALAVVLALAACKPATPAEPAAPAAPPAAVAATPSVGEPGYSPPDAEDGPMECLAYVDLLRDAINEGRATGDTGALRAASDAARREANKGKTDDEVSQYYNSSVAVFDDLPIAELKRKADVCVTRFVL